jgi:hypothetical protein
VCGADNFPSFFTFSARAAPIKQRRAKLLDTHSGGVGGGAALLGEILRESESSIAADWGDKRVLSARRAQELLAHKI